MNKRHMLVCFHDADFLLQLQRVNPEVIPSTVGNIRTLAGQQTVEIVVLHPFVGVVG